MFPFRGNAIIGLNLKELFPTFVPLVGLIAQPWNIMTAKHTSGLRPLAYESPLAEEILVSFEECILSNTTSSELKDRFFGTDGTAGAPDDLNDFDGGTIDL